MLLLVSKCLILLPILGQVVWAKAPTLTLYSEPNQAGFSVTFTQPHRDLGITGFNDETDSICGQGLWFLYEDHDFSDTSEFIHEFASPSMDRCEDLDMQMRNRISSARYAGADNMDMQVLTMYEHGLNAGLDFEVIGDVDYLKGFDDMASSFAVVGNSSWTIYEHPEYSGQGACMTPLEHNGFFYGVWDIAEFPIENDKVSSARKGCFSTTVLKYDPNVRKLRSKPRK